MQNTNFENLQIYQLAELFSDLAWNIVISWKPLAQDTVGKQLIRAADSVGANIAEGDGKASFLDNRRYRRNARGSLYECKHWLRRAESRGLVTPEQLVELNNNLDILIPKLNAYLKWINVKIGNEKAI